MYKALSCFLCFLLLFLSGPVLAQSNNLRFHAVRLPGTFPTAGIKMAIRDKAGLLWYSTNDGLYRYDGSEVLHFGRNTTPALPHLSLVEFRPDEQGNLWLVFEKGMAAKFDLKTWTITPLYVKAWKAYRSGAEYICTVACLTEGRVYFGTDKGKLYIVKNDSLQQVADVKVKITHIDEPEAGQLWLATDKGELVNIPISHGVYGHPRYYRLAEAKGKFIDNICYDSSGKVLFSIDHSGMLLTDLHELQAHRSKASYQPDGDLIKGLASPIAAPADHSDMLFSPFHIGDKHVAVMTGLPGHPRNIYMFDFKTKAWQLVTPSFPVKLPGLIAYISRYPGGALVSSTEGLTRLWFQKSPITSLLGNRVSKNSVRSIYKKGKTLYIGSYRDGFVSYDEHSGKVSRLVDAAIYSILPWNRDSLLLANEGDGLFWYIPDGNKLTPIPVRSLTGQRPKSRFSTVLCRVNDSLVLEGTYMGVNLINPVKGTYYPVFRNSLFSKRKYNKINAIMPVADRGTGLGIYLLATLEGVFRINPGNGFVQYFLRDSVPPEIRRTTIFCLLSLDGQIWMGSAGLGILAADTQGRQLPMGWLNARLTGQMIYSLTQSGNDVLIGTDKGLNVLHLKDSSISYYTTYNGLPAEEFNLAAVFNDGKTVYLGTVNGIIRWTYGGPGMQDKLLAPRIHINKLTVVEKNHSKTVSYNFPYLPKDSQRIVIPANAAYFSLAFGGPEEGTNSLEYYYRLSSRKDWIGLGDMREVTFIKTPPGHYRLQFATKIPGQDIIPGSRVISLIVKPSFLQTIWFKILLALSFAGILLFIFRYREIHRNKERSLRMKIAGDLHDEVGSALSTIWHQTHKVLQLTSPEIKPIAKPLRTVADISGDALSVMNDIVWSIDARFDTMDEFVVRVKDYIYKLQNELEVPVKLEITGRYKNRKLSQIIRQNLFLWFKEAVNNAMKHGDGNLISVEMHIADKLRMQVSNTCSNTCGKSLKIIQGGRGLQIMERRAAHMDGVLQMKQDDNNFTIAIMV